MNYFNKGQRNWCCIACESSSYMSSFSQRFSFTLLLMCKVSVLLPHKVKQIFSYYVNKLIGHKRAKEETKVTRVLLCVIFLLLSSLTVRYSKLHERYRKMQFLYIYHICIYIRMFYK